VSRASVRRLTVSDFDRFAQNKSIWEKCMELLARLHCMDFARDRF